MANEQNLIPQNLRTKSEQREIARMGGVASGVARRQKATMLSVLANTLDQEDAKSKLTYRELATLGLIKGAVKGSGHNYEIIQNLMREEEQRNDRERVEIILPAKDVASSFCDINRSIDDREYREYYLEGGRGSTKSSFVSEKIIELIENNPKMCAVALRKVKETLKDSVFAQIEWAIDMLGETYASVKNDYKVTKNPLEITKISTGQKIYFRGADDYGKIKGLKTPGDMYVGVTWFEEFDQFNGMNEIRKINQSLVRRWRRLYTILYIQHASK